MYNGNVEAIHDEEINGLIEQRDKLLKDSTDR